MRQHSRSADSSARSLSRSPAAAGSTATSSLVVLRAVEANRSCGTRGHAGVQHVHTAAAAAAGAQALCQLLNAYVGGCAILAAGWCEA